jgi:hypothetical protein
MVRLLASKYDSGKFLKSQDIQGERRFKIKSVSEEDVGQGRDKERKLVVWFTNDQRGLVLNLTNIRVLRGAFGDVCDDWAGKVIVVFVAQTEFRGEIKPGLRVRIPPPKTAPVPEPVAAVEEELNDEVEM